MLKQRRTCCFLFLIFKICLQSVLNESQDFQIFFSKLVYWKTKTLFFFLMLLICFVLLKYAIKDSFRLKFVGNVHAPSSKRAQERQIGKGPKYFPEKTSDLILGINCFDSSFQLKPILRRKNSCWVISITLYRKQKNADSSLLLQNRYA